MKVYFHARGALIDSPHFHYTFNYPPKGITYVREKNDGSDVILNMQAQRTIKFFAHLAKSMFNAVHMSAVNMSSVGEKAEKCKLIHSFNTIPATTKPFIIELESFHALFIGGAKDSRAIKKIQNTLVRKNCKKVLFWTQNAHDNFFKLINSPTIKKKSIVLYPGVPLYAQNRQHRVPTIGFIARDCLNKGGGLVIPLMKDFVESGRAKAIIVTDIDLLKENNKELYEKYSKWIDFHPLMQRSDLHKHIFPKIDILFYPGYSDTFGYIFPEAMSHGIPIVTVDGCARKELVSKFNGIVAPAILNEWGYLAELETLNKLDDLQLKVNMALTNILSCKKCRKSMSDCCYDSVKNGIFSLYNRNEILTKVYEDALR